MTAARSPRALAELVCEMTGGASISRELSAAIRAATLYCERPDRPGYRALGTPGTGLIPTFTSTGQLARASGPVAWFSLSGAELVDTLPPGYDLLLDLAGEVPLRLRGTGPEVARVSLLGRYCDTHDVVFGAGVGAPDWLTWVTRRPDRGIGDLEPDLLDAAGPRPTQPPTCDTALTVIGLRPEQLRRVVRAGRRAGTSGIAAPATAVETSTETWRTNLHHAPRTESVMPVWSGPGYDRLSRATVAPAVSLDSGELEVRGVVLRSGPPPAEGHRSGRGRRSTR